jgi:hypothetical protein
MQGKIRLFSLLFVVVWTILAATTVMVSAENRFTIAGYLSQWPNGSWYLGEEVCHSMRASKLYLLDPSQQALWQEYSNTGASRTVVVLEGSMGQSGFFHADRVMTYSWVDFCNAYPIGVAEFPTTAAIVLGLASLLAGLLVTRKWTSRAS